MILNHINFLVDDVPANKALFENYFGFESQVDRGDRLAVMSDSAGTTLVLLNFKNSNAINYTDDIAAFHIGFSQDDKQAVDDIYDKLVAAGYAPDAPPRNAHGSWTFYFKAPGGFFIEVFSRNQ